MLFYVRCLHHVCQILCIKGLKAGLIFQDHSYLPLRIRFTQISKMSQSKPHSHTASKKVIREENEIRNNHRHKTKD